MNDRTKKGTADASAQSGDAFASFFKHTKPRQRPPVADEQIIRESLHAEWHAVASRRVFITRATWMAAAASVLVLAVSVLVAIRPSLLYPEPVVVAEIERAQGDIELSRDGVVLPQASLQERLVLISGHVVSTRDGQAAFRLSQGGSLRLTANTRVAFISSSEVELLRGALYFDSQSTSDSSESLTVHTRVGAVRDVGTQFIARLAPDLLEISVREGAVVVDRGDEQIEARLGERVSVLETGRVARESIAVFGDEWSWVEQLAPSYDIDGRSVFEFLAWLERETGREVVFMSPETEQHARDTVLRGRIDFEPMPMLRAVMATTDLSYTVTAGQIVVSIR